MKKIITKHRKIITKIPSNYSNKIIDACKKFEPDSMNNQLPVVWKKAIGYQIFDYSGNIWIDFTSGIFVTNVGHSHPKVKKAIQNVVKKDLLYSYYYPTKERAEFGKLLTKTTGFEKALFLTTGSEAVEAAIKMALKYGVSKGKTRIIGFTNTFHGKTMGAQLAGGKTGEQSWIPVNSHVIRMPFPTKSNLDLESLVNKFNSIDPQNIAAVIMEPYLGFSAEFMDVEYVKQIEKWCKENDVLLIVDEIQAGFGRTGKLFAYQHYNINPDIVTCGKAISSNFPVSAVLSSSKIINICESFNSTHGSNPIGMAAAKASLEVLIEENLIEESRRKGELLNKLLLEWKNESNGYIENVNCKGLLAGIKISHENINSCEFVDKIIEIAMKKGLLSVKTSSGTLKIGPPLSIPDDALIEGINILKESFRECLGMLE